MYFLKIKYQAQKTIDSIRAAASWALIEALYFKQCGCSAYHLDPNFKVDEVNLEKHWLMLACWPKQRQTKKNM